MAKQIELQFLGADRMDTAQFFWIVLLLYCIFYLQKTITNYDKKNISNHMIITLDLLGQQDKFHFLNSLSLM